MNKYELALAVKQRNESLIKDFENQVYVAKQRDKNGLGCWSGKLERPRESGYRRVVLSVTMQHGYYGSSYCSSDASEEAAHAIADTLNGMKDGIIARTIARLRAQVVFAAREAADEAREILAQVEKGESE